MNKRLIVLAFLLLPLATQAQEQEVYKTVLEDGTVIYTDQKPSEDAEPIDLPELTIIKSEGLPPPQPTTTRPAAQRENISYPAFQITSPNQDETFWGSGGQVSISASLGRSLANGHRVVMFMDGNPVGNGLSLSLSDVDRGAHTLTAQVLDGRGNVIASAEPVVFHMKQASINN